jgi:predicted GNAT family acetyltransferase
VPSAYQGRGLAALLVEAGLQWAKAEGLRVVPACTYVQSYIQRHPEWQHLVA